MYGCLASCGISCHRFASLPRSRFASLPHSSFANSLCPFKYSFTNSHLNLLLMSYCSAVCGFLLFLWLQSVFLAFWQTFLFFFWFYSAFLLFISRLLGLHAYVRSEKFVYNSVCFLQRFLTLLNGVPRFFAVYISDFFLGCLNGIFRPI